MRWTSLALILAFGLAACGGSKPPTSPSSSGLQVTAPSNAPTGAIDVKADAAGSRDAVAALSEVIADASGSIGKGLTYAIDFGDGATATTASATHVYAAPATYTITATVTDSEGRKATGTKQIAVRDATGSWFQAGYVAKTKRVEVRRLSIDAQTGTTVRGTYRVTGDVDRAFTGTLIPPRDIRMTATGGVSLIGTLPGRLNDDATPWTLVSGGDSADGQRLDFRAITGPPDAAPPVADLKLRVGRENPWEYVFGYTPGPIPAVTPIQIDGTASRGTDLSYFIEFGDGAVATTSQATRVVDLKEPDTYSLTARITVVDRFGRSDSRSREYYFFSMPTGGGGDSWFTGNLPDGGLWMTFPGRSGATYGASVTRNGLYPRPGYSGNGSAVVSGDGDIRVTIPALGIEYRGKLTLTASWSDVWLTVVQYGGADDGRTWRLFIRPYS